MRVVYKAAAGTGAPAPPQHGSWTLKAGPLLPLQRVGCNQAPPLAEERLPQKPSRQMGFFFTMLRDTLWPNRSRMLSMLRGKQTPGGQTG